MTTVKLALTSDLYLPVTPADKLVELARAMAATEPDAAVLAGDLADSLADYSRVLALFRKELRCPVWVLPGDVDFWARPPYDSRRLWTELLPQAVTNAGCSWLEGVAFTLGGCAVAGTIGWYDYSASPMSGMVSALEFAQQKYLHNADALRIDWEYSDPEFASEVGFRLLTTLEQLDQASGVEQVVVITHFPILDGQIVRRPGGGFACAYSANLTLGKKVLSHRKVTHIVSGHTHVARHGTVPRDPLPAVEYHVLPGDYEKPGWLALTIGA